MKKIVIALLISLCASFASAQIQTKIIGNWKVLDVESTKELKLNKKEQKQLERLKKSTLEFTSDQHVKFHLFLSNFNIADGYWYYNEKKDVIVITEWENRNVDRMRLWYDELENGDLRFYIDETPFVIVVTRVTEDNN